MKNPLSGRTKEQALLDAERLKQRLKDMEQTKAELKNSQSKERKESMQ